MLWWTVGTRRTVKLLFEKKTFPICMPFLQFDDSSATVEYTPKSSDNGKYLRCRGVNPHLADEAVEDQWKISVHGQL